MKIEIKVPNMGESVTEAVVSRLLVSNGDMVKRDQEILELETDKVNQVLYAPQEGTISFYVKVGDIVKIAQTIASVDGDTQTPSPPKQEAKPLPPPPKHEGSSRAMASDFITELKQPPKQPPAPSVEKEIPPKETPQKRKKMSGLRRTIAQRLVEVKNKTAMLTTFNEVDMSRILEIRAQEKEGFQARYGVKLGFMSFFVKASVSALKAFPEISASIQDEDIVYPEALDIGVAVSTEKGLMVPVIRDCETLSFGAIEKQLEAYASQARNGSLSIDQLKGGCFTITNGGVFGSLLSTPILNPPQSAILGMHAIVKRAVVVNDAIVIRPMMYLALSYDHRIVDGKEAVQFLGHLKENLEDPARLLLDL